MNEWIDEDGVVLTQAEYRAGLGKGRVRQVLTGFERSIVDESKVPETDLNVLVKRWMRGEPVPEFAPGVFGNVADAGSFQEMQNRLLVVRGAFASLPAHVREYFNNSAVLFADSIAEAQTNEKLAGELMELGVLAKPEVKSEAPAGEPAKPAEPAVPKAEPPADKPPEGARQ